jgi:hypothetical protein
MEIYNLNSKKDTSMDKYIRNYFAPVIGLNGIRMVLAGKSGGGKTMVVANLILNYLRYDRIFIYARHLFDEGDVYLMIIKVLQKIEKRIRKKTKNEDYQFLWYSDKYEDIPKAESFDAKYVNLVIVDDFMNEKDTSRVTELYTSGRHRGVSVIFLAQTLWRCDRTMREQCNYLLFFEFASARELRLLSSEFASDLEYSDLLNIFRQCLNEKYSFLVIDLKTNEPSLRYRRKWDGLLITDENDSDSEEKKN